MDAREAARAVYQRGRHQRELVQLEAELEARLVRVGKAALRALDEYMDSFERGEATGGKAEEFLRLWTVYVVLRSGRDIRALGSALKEVRSALCSGKGASKDGERPEVAISL